MLLQQKTFWFFFFFIFILLTFDSPSIIFVAFNKPPVIFDADSAVPPIIPDINDDTPLPIPIPKYLGSFKNPQFLLNQIFV